MWRDAARQAPGGSMFLRKPLVAATTYTEYNRLNAKQSLNNLVRQLEPFTAHMVSPQVAV